MASSREKTHYGGLVTEGGPAGFGGNYRFGRCRGDRSGGSRFVRGLLGISLQSVSLGQGKWKQGTNVSWGYVWDTRATNADAVRADEPVLR